MKPRLLSTAHLSFSLATAIAALLAAPAANAVDVTYTGVSGTFSATDRWNTASNWDTAAIPTGAVNVILAANKYVVVNTATTTPTYTGSLSIGANSTLQIGYAQTGDASLFNALGNGNVTMAAGSKLLSRNGASTMTLNSLTLTGNAIVSTGDATAGTTAQIGAISGAYQLTLNSSASGISNLNSANSFSSLVLTSGTTGSWTTRGGSGNVKANVAGALSGDVTLTDGTLTFGTAAGALDIMGNTKVLRIDSVGASRVVMTASDTIGGLYLYGVKQIGADYTTAGRGASFMSGSGTLTIADATAAYWDLNNTTAGSGGAAPAGTWSAANTNWNATAAGSGSTGTWTAGQAAWFSAGSDAVGSYGITVSGTQDIGALGFDRGSVSFSGDGLRLVANAPIYVATGASASIANTISEDVAGRELNKSGGGTLVLSGTNTYSGVTAVGGGVLSISSVANAGTASNIGQYATAGAGGIILGGGTLQYTGGTASTDRGFTLTNSSTVDVVAGTTLTMGAVTISNPSTLTVTGGGTLATGAVLIGELNPTFNPTASSLNIASLTSLASLNTSQTVTLGGSSTGNTIGSIVNGANSNAITVNKSGIGTWAFIGTNTNTNGYTFGGGGTMILDYGTTNTSKLADGTTPIFDGTTLTLKGGATGSHIEIVTATSLYGRGTFITRDGANTAKLRLNAITRQAGGTISFGDANIADTDTNNFGASGANGIIGGWATLGNDWAVSANTGAANTSITALASGSYNTTVTGAGSATTNYRLEGGTTLAAAFAAGSLKIINTADSDTLALDANNLTITSTSATALGGIMYAGGNNGLYSITGSTGRIVTSIANQELIFAVQTGTLSVGALVGASGSTGAVTKSGAGTLEISSNNNFTGAVRVNEGVLRLANANATGTSAGNIVVQNGAALELTNAITVGAEALTITGTGVTNGGALRNITGTNNSTYQGNITIGNGGARINADGTTTLNVRNIITAAGADVTFGGTGNITHSTTKITGTGAVIKDGAGTLNLNFANDYTGGTFVNNGSVVLGANNILADTGVVTVNGGTLDINTRTDTVGTVTLSGGSITGSSGVLTGTSYDVRSGSISAILGGTGGLTKTTTGTVVLTGANTYSGPTYVTNGTLSIGTVATPTGSINNSAVTVNGGTFRYNSTTTDYTGTLTFISGTISGTNMNGNLSGQTIGTGKTISPGNSPGTASTDSQTWAVGGNYDWEINNATGTAGVDPGWDLLNGTGDLTISAIDGSEFNLLLTSLTLANAPGPATNFNNTSNYNWLIADFASVTGFAADAFNINTSGFGNTFTGTFGVATGDMGTIGGDSSQIYLTYTVVPEPNVAALLGGLGSLMLLRRRRN